MDFTLWIAIAAWCGGQMGSSYGQQGVYHSMADVQQCRERMMKCLILNKTKAPPCDAGVLCINADSLIIKNAYDSNECFVKEKLK